MEKILIDLNNKCGKIKHMNSVNNGPFKSVRNFDTFDAFKAARIPYARNHDASFFSAYGGEFTVDVHRIFRDFSRDENDPKSYSFASTDIYLKTIEAAGTKTFYRLGSNIEHYEKCGTIPPPDNRKWARICEHIIRHYTEGWADGFFMDIEYWEIWNEPDCGLASGSSPCWQGTQDEFIDLFAVTYKHLKSCFPHLKIGGPAFAYLPECYDFATRLFKRLNDENLKLDFFSYHCYARDTEWFGEMINMAHKFVIENGQPDTELILNEWNYVRGWAGEEWKHSLQTEKGLKGSSFVTACMATGQKLPVDMLMYYDARPCGMNGLFHTDTYECLKTYYSIAYFSNLLELGTYLPETSTSKDLYTVAACKDGELGILLTHFNDEIIDAKDVEITLKGVNENASAKVYVLDENNDMALYKECSLENGKLTLNVPLYTSYYISVK